MMFVSLADLKLVAANEPKRFRALADWVAGGPC